MSINIVQVIMFKLIFELLIDPLGLPVEWYYEYVILAIIGILAYSIAYSQVGGMYRSGFISGRTSGSFFHWLIRLFLFVVLWGITYGVIWIGKFIVANLKTVLSSIIFVTIIIILITLYEKRRRS